MFETIKQIRSVGLSNYLNTSEIDIDLIADYNEEIKTSSDKQATLAKFTQNTNQATAELIKQSNGMVVSEKAKQKAINTSTNAAKASKVAMSALATAGNMLLVMAISKGVEWLILDINCCLIFSLILTW